MNQYSGVHHAFINNSDTDTIMYKWKHRHRICTQIWLVTLQKRGLQDMMSLSLDKQYYRCIIDIVLLVEATINHGYQFNAGTGRKS
jgi:hypothetical protein